MKAETRIAAMEFAVQTGVTQAELIPLAGKIAEFLEPSPPKPTQEDQDHVDRLTKWAERIHLDIQGCGKESAARIRKSLQLAGLIEQ